MENKQRIRPLTPTERKFIEEKHHLIIDFLKRQRLDIEEFYDVVVFDYILSVEKYLSNTDLQEKCQFEAVAYMYMKRAVYRYFREQKAQKRRSEAGADISFDEVDAYIGKSINSMENSSSLEYEETIKQIESILTLEQQQIFFDKLEGYTLKEIADNNGIKPKRVYKQFGKIKSVVADVMDEQRLLG
ncbi:MAG: ECF-type sigma factor [Lachnospiraceae bacterium]|nr:ECF-type sigma factor [Lachnospiraceae bacterium]